MRVAQMKMSNFRHQTPSLEKIEFIMPMVMVGILFLSTIMNQIISAYSTMFSTTTELTMRQSGAMG